MMFACIAFAGFENALLTVKGRLKIDPVAANQGITSTYVSIIVTVVMVANRDDGSAASFNE